MTTIKTALVTLVTSTDDGPLHTNDVGQYTDLEEAMSAAKKACGSPQAEGESAGPGSMRYVGPLGTAYVGW